MASSRKRRSKERKLQQSQPSSSTEYQENNPKKKKSKGGCYGKKSQKRKYNDSGNKPSANMTNHTGVEHSSKYQSSSANHTGEGLPLHDANRSYKYDATDNVARKTVTEDTGRRNDLDGGFHPQRNTDNYERTNFDKNSGRQININDSSHPYVTNNHYERDMVKGGYQSDHNNSFRNQNRSSYSYEHNATAPRFNGEKKPMQTGGHNSEHVHEEILETRVFRKRGKESDDDNVTSKKLHGVVSGSDDRTNSSEQFRRIRRASVVSKVSSSFSSGSSFRRKHGNNVHGEGEKSFKTEKVYSTETGQNRERKLETVVSVQRNVGSLGKGGSSQIATRTAPVLKTNKSYNISFAMTEKAAVQQDSLASHSKITSIETYQTGNKGELKRRKSSKRIQTDEAYLKGTSRKDNEDFSRLMNDVDYYDGQRVRIAEKMNKVSSKEEGKKAVSSYDETDRGMRVASERKGGINGGNNSSSYERRMSSGADNRSGQMTSEWRSAGNKNEDIGDSVYMSESVTYKEWMLVEHSDGKQEKREYRREVNDEGDTLYIDILTGNVLKTEKAEWKSGQELVREKKGTEIIGYEWRKDLGTNEWVKYNSANNEILRRGDWKTGSEWHRNSKGKLVERSYTYVRNADGRWVKSDPRSGMVIDYSGCSALRGSYWVPIKKGGKTKNKKWRKQDFEYIQTNKGLWLKQDPVTKKKLKKPSKKGWKEGIDYHMDKDGKVKKVHYVWQTESSGLMTKVNKKTNEPVNTMWMRGREVIMQDNKVVTNNFCWVKSGKNQWVKIDEDTGKPLTNKIKSNKIGNYNQSDSQSKTYVTKTSKRMDNNQIIEENTKIEQNGGGIVKNTTKTIKY